MFLWHAVHDGYLGNASPGRLQIYGFLDLQCQQRWPKTSVRERRLSRHENQTDPDVSFGWFEATRHLSQSLPVVLGFGYLCPIPSLPLGVRLLCLLGMVVKRIVSQYVLPHMWRAHLNQTGGLQGLCNVSCDDLAENDLGAGSGWQQSRQNWRPSAVMRY